MSDDDHKHDLFRRYKGVFCVFRPLYSVLFMGSIGSPKFICKIFKGLGYMKLATVSGG